MLYLHQRVRTPEGGIIQSKGYLVVLVSSRLSQSPRFLAALDEIPNAEVQDRDQCLVGTGRGLSVMVVWKHTASFSSGRFATVEYAALGS
jgi:hypothetical protein